jgi:hypothetical protein
MKTTLIVVAAMTLAATASAQVFVHDPQARAEKEQQLQILTDKVSGSAVHLSVEARPVSGAPYSGEAVTETVQVLADGNRIVRRTTARVYRDGKGRTRRETIGPDGQVTSILISDPSAGRTFVVDPGTNTVRHTGSAFYVASDSGSGTGSGSGSGSGGSFTYYVSSESKQQIELKAAHEAELTAKQHAEQQAAQTGAKPGEQAAKLHAELKAAQQREVQSHTGGVTVVGPGTWVTEYDTPGAAAPTREALGQQTVEGVAATGTRTTTVIPAGAIGNEQPITVTSEEWYSPDLKMLVMTKHADPRSGETTYRLTGIARGEPSPSLFDPPAGVVVK